MTDVVIVLTTVPVGEAGDRIARALVDERLAACVNLLAPMVSTYRWEGSVHRDEERQVMIKTTRALLPAVRSRIAATHPYDLPELLVLAVEDGAPAYLEWVRRETGNSPTG
jgi:periplasmic divalent cation tolerance protein